jgi:tRNA 2-thiouridine synthesizing protein A
MAENHSETELDLSGLLCPLPVLKARKHLMSMTPGQVLKVIATDPMSAIDMPHFCGVEGHMLLDHTHNGDQYVFRIRCK